jgi:hypothetical protein
MQVERLEPGEDFEGGSRWLAVGGYLFVIGVWVCELICLLPLIH